MIENVEAQLMKRKKKSWKFAWDFVGFGWIIAEDSKMLHTNVSYVKKNSKNMIGYYWADRLVIVILILLETENNVLKQFDLLYEVLYRDCIKKIE